MADDLANDWGCELCIPDKYARSLKAPHLPRVTVPSERTHSSNLSALVASETDNKFVFDRVSICGSEANSWAINDATNLMSSRCLFAAGSYVAGDRSALQSFSTSEFTLGADLAFITPPDDVPNAVARENTVPLPYHIPGVLPHKELIAYEDECLQAVHIRLVWAKMRRLPYKAILLELVLAGNGATLSNRALIAIGKLAVHHGMCVIVDEIMTGGRTESMLLVLSKPTSFQDAVTHITCGKWCQMGMVILSKSWAEKREKLYPFTMRGASTILCETEATIHWKCVKKHKSDIAIKRAKVLKKLKLDEVDVWGVGLLLFGPCRRETIHGLKCRYLPLIHKGTPIDAVRTSLLMDSTDFKSMVNKLIMDATRKWVVDMPQPMVDVESTESAIKLDAERLSDYSFLAKLIKASRDREVKSSDEWKEFCKAEKVNPKQGEAVLRRLKTAGCMEQTRRGSKRKRGWKLKENVIAPWKTEEFDELLNH